ncbi:DoxX family membrane protein [Elizabethkingia argentiflava]|uniref:DoxX family membrane protein n=1 Tax=Elizabethkingia argenteiflava TaxID=2681556 RepID=A0A845PVJ2_9FLAO|nr:DoxX family protein [Elizabethkingia argenteiflava]NAW50318.1 DoxX family membrane protein [Elizabethkingia argenteiflava]
MEKENLNKIGDIFYVICRIGIGLFFLITGVNKMFNPILQEYMLNTITNLGFSNPEFIAHFVAFNEAFWGLLLLLGLFTRFSSLLLVVIIFSAVILKDIHSIPTELVPLNPKSETQPINVFTWLSYFFFLPQVLIIMLLGQFTFYGYKLFGLDSAIQKRDL